MYEVVDKIKAEGRAIGMAKGEDNIINLYKILKSKNRLTDFAKLAHDEIYLRGVL